MKKYAQICKDAGVASQVAGNAIQAALPSVIARSGLSQDIKLGALGAFGATQLVAAAAALATPTRSNKQQLKAGISPWHTLGNLFVPGMASYNLYKRYGNAMAQESVAAKERDIKGATKALKDKDANVRQTAKAYLKMRKAKAYTKQASLRGDVAGDLAYTGLLSGSAVLPFYYLASQPGMFGANFKSKKQGTLTSAIPIVGAQRVNNSLDSQSKLGVLPGYVRAKRYSQLLSPFASPLLGALAGAGIGAGVGAHMSDGALAGAGVGAAASLLALALAAVTPTWSKEKTRDYLANSSGLANILVPGLGTYNRYKRIGRAIEDQQKGITKQQQLKSLQEQNNQNTPMTYMQAHRRMQRSINDMLKPPEPDIAQAKPNNKLTVDAPEGSPSQTLGNVK